MSNFNNQAASKVQLIGHVVVLITLFVVAYLFSIEGGKEYGWFAGFFHGGWVVPNYIFSLFIDNYYVKAPLHTTAYNVFWWITCISGMIYLINILFKIIKLIRNISRK